jgi:hypothetical protein
MKPSNTSNDLKVPVTSKKKQTVLTALENTPSRGYTKLSNPLALVEATPATNRLRPDLQAETPLLSRLTTKSGRTVLFTPVKLRDLDSSEALMFRDAPEIPERAGRAMDRVMGRRGIEDGFSGGFGFAAPSTSQVGNGSPLGADDDFSVSKPVDRLSRPVGVPALVAAPLRDGGSIYAQLGWDEDDDL